MMNIKETKKRTLVIAFVILAIAFTVIALSATSKTTKAITANETVLVGDVDNDGIITGSDATLVLSYYTNCSAGNNLYIDMLRADVDNNGIITGSDATLILQYYTIISAGGAIDWPPYETTTSTTTTKPTTTTTAVASEFQIGDTVEFVGQRWNVRNSPQFSENIVSTIKTNEVFDIVGIVNDYWYIISNESFEYKFIQIENDISYNFNIWSSSETESIPIFNIGNNLKFIGTSWNKRTTPKFSIDNIISELENGDSFEIIGYLANDWYLISEGGTFAYIQITESSNYNFSEISSETPPTLNPSIATEMQLTIEELQKKYPGIRIGVGLYTPNGAYTYNANEAISSCCTVKASYALHVLKECVMQGIDIYTEKITYQPWHYNDGSGDTKYEEFGKEFTIYELLHDLIVISDNTDYNILTSMFSLEEFFAYNRSIGGQGDGLQYGSASVTQRKAEWDQIINYINSDAKYASVLYNLLDGAYYSYLEEGMPSWHTVLHKSGWSTGLYYTGACDVAFIDDKYLLIVMTDDKATGIAHTDALWAFGNVFDRYF